MSDGKNPNHYSPDKSNQDGGGFMEFLYNKETGQVLGRSGSSWAKIITFYIFFFIGLALFFGLMFFVFYQFLDLNQPRWQKENGLIGSNPGIGYRPTPDQDKYPESTLIWMNAKEESEKSGWGDDVEKFVKKYSHSARTGQGQDCTFQNGLNATDKSYCFLDVEAVGALGACEGGQFGYLAKPPTPCVIVKLNKIYGWTPEPYSAADLDSAETKEKEMPKWIQDKIRNLTREADGGDEGAKRKLSTIWITCEGENPGDKEAMGKIEIISPNQGKDFPGIPSFYFPYKNQEGYQTPFVFVRFERPAPNQLIQMECKGWAKNIAADRQLRLGSVHFELMIDGLPSNYGPKEGQQQPQQGKN